MTLIRTAIIFLVCSCISVAAHSQPLRCIGSLDKFKELIERSHQEVAHIRLYGKNKSYKIIFWNGKTGTWTEVIVLANGKACVEAAGKDFDVANPYAQAERPL